MTGRRARFLAPLAFAACLPMVVSAQIATRIADQTADNESWYLSGAPINLGGIIYYPAGPIVHFNRNEMVFTGLFERVPVFKRTTQEPGSVLYVPLAGGLVRPYERRRSGELAGTVGSSSPSFPVSLPAAEASATGPGFFGEPTPAIPRPVGTTGFVYGAAAPEPRATGSEAFLAVPVGTTGFDPGTASPLPLLPSGPARVETVTRPAGVNGIFIEFRDARWFAAGPAVVLRSGQFTRIGDYHGFGVYTENERAGTIFLSSVAGEPTLVVPYAQR